MPIILIKFTQISYISFLIHNKVRAFQECQPLNKQSSISGILSLECLGVLGMFTSAMAVW